MAAPITSYATLVDAIVDRMNDSALDDFAPEFIQLAEALFNRELNNLDMEGTATLDLTSAATTVSLPTDYKGLRSLHLDDHGPLTQLGPVDFQTRWADDSRAEPEDFAIFGGVIHFGPMPDGDYTATMTYLRTLTGLSATSTTNWLLEQHPDLYLYGALTQAEFRGWNDDRLPMLGTLVDNTIVSINKHDARKRRGDNPGTVAVSYF